MSIIPAFFRTRTRDVVLVEVAAAQTAAARLKTDTTPAQITKIAHARDAIRPSRYSEEDTLALFERQLPLVMRDLLAGDTRMKKPGRIACFIPSIFARLHIHTIEISEEEPFAVTRELIEDIVRDDLEGAGRKLAHRTAGLPKGPTVVVDHAITDLLVNGYHVKNPYGTRTRSCAVSVCLSFTTEPVLSALTRAFAPFAESVDIDFHAQSFAVYAALRDRFGEHKSFAAIVLNRENTDILVVHCGALRRVVTFPFGRNTIIRALAARLNGSTGQAEAALSMLARGELNAESAQAITGALESIEDDWSGAIKRAFRGSSIARLLPRRWFVIADSTLNDTVRDWLSHDPTIEQDNLTVRTLDSRAWSDLVRGSASVRDPLLYCEAAFTASSN